eukprot:649757-Rhodomonas_salina.1
MANSVHKEREISRSVPKQESAQESVERHKAKTAAGMPASEEEQRAGRDVGAAVVMEGAELAGLVDPVNVVAGHVDDALDLLRPPQRLQHLPVQPCPPRP